MICKFVICILILLFCNLCYCLKSKHLIFINDSNWRQILKGEWMINFYSKAAWCPACKEMDRPWNAFADWSFNKKIKVAQVDLSENPGLSGRFLLTVLPTIYHVKDGVFRTYTGPKDKEDFMKFYKNKQWSTMEQLPAWCYPDSMQMTLVSWLFTFSMSARDFHNHLVDKKGLPSITSFGIFGLITLVIGCILGSIMVVIIDQIVPSGKNSGKRAQQGQQSKKDKKNGKVHENGKVKTENDKNGAVTSADDDSSVRQRKQESSANGHSKHGATNFSTNDKKKH